MVGELCRVALRKRDHVPGKYKIVKEVTGLFECLFLESKMFRTLCRAASGWLTKDRKIFRESAPVQENSIARTLLASFGVDGTGTQLFFFLRGSCMFHGPLERRPGTRSSELIARNWIRNFPRGTTVSRALASFASSTRCPRYSRFFHCVAISLSFTLIS